jgi:hypothetical protein
MTGRGTKQVGQFRSKDACTITVHIPMTMRHQGDRKQVVTPAGATPWIPIPPRVNNTLVKAIVRAHRWRDMLETGNYATVRDLAKAEAIDEVYLGRVLRLTLLSPTLIELSSKADSLPPSNSTISFGNSQSSGTDNSEA